MLRLILFSILSVHFIRRRLFRILDENCIVSDAGFGARFRFLPVQSKRYYAIKRCSKRTEQQRESRTYERREGRKRERPSCQ